MPTLFNESNKSAGGGSSSGSEGIQLNPVEVTGSHEQLLLCSPGWPNSVGKASGVSIGDERKESLFSWRPIKVRTVRWGHPAHMLLLQGISPAQFFLSLSMESSHFQMTGLHLLSYKLEPLWQVPCAMQNVLLGQLLSLKEGTPLAAVLPSMLQIFTKEYC